MKLSDIPKLGSKFWKELGGKIPFWVKEDALKGLMQDNKQNLRYKSETYKKYKANDMRRFTRGEGKTFSDKEGYFYGKTYFTNKKAGFSKSKGFGTGQRLKEYKGQPIESRDTQFVNLTLTGKMINSLKPKNSGEDWVIMAFSPDQAGKVIGNKRYGYNVVGLNDKNKLKVKAAMITEMKKRQLELPKKLVINVSV